MEQKTGLVKTQGQRSTGWRRIQGFLAPVGRNGYRPTSGFKPLLGTAKEAPTQPHSSISGCFQSSMSYTSSFPLRSRPTCGSFLLPCLT